MRTFQRIVKGTTCHQAHVLFALLLSGCAPIQTGYALTPSSPAIISTSEDATNEQPTEIITATIHSFPTPTTSLQSTLPTLLTTIPEGRVALTSSHGDLFVVNSDNELIQLTFDGLDKLDSDAAWSPDGHWLAFASEFVTSPYLQLRIIDPDQPADTPLQVEVVGDVPTWSPTGIELIYFGMEGLMRMDVDGTDQTMLVDYETLVSDDYAGASTLIAPQWSSDGQWLAFSQVFGNGCEHAILLLDLGNFTFQELLYYAQNPAWSPDGRRIAFDMCNENYSNFDIWIMNVDGSDLTRLTTNPSYDVGPVWSPSGQYIMFTSDRDGDLDYYIMNADGTNQVRLTQGDVWGVAWGP